ncbi:MAG: 4-hydroxy-tetrahydrodipicolinate reductase [Verrucomicrobia bacterium]|nr:4-hydroxy-tetrahydrodipicolinate reductase [Verrucomicrobiota bacterium]
MSTKVVIVGASGRMGGALARCIHNGAVEGIELAGAIDVWDAPGLSKDVGVASGVGEMGVAITSDLAAVAEDADVLIDFSFHTGCAENARRAAEWGKAVVVGTTGFSDDEKAMIQEASKRIPVVMAPNMSLGVNLLLSLAKRAASALKGKGYDVEIVERHHRRKKDAPSGTALGLGEAVAEGLNWDLKQVAQHGRAGLSPDDRPLEQIGFHAVRGGDIVGDHTVIFAADGECVELSHRATSRDAFAVGALQAAAWIAGREAGLYSMLDVLGLD